VARGDDGIGEGKRALVAEAGRVVAMVGGSDARFLAALIRTLIPQ
jgi:hypothetical protein